ncbi:MAG: tetratricopeptide repeat protein [Capsulimonadales bacterium]|nr:tetratricopeptide repeat protein [Capsulimonadales bacterium]
MKFLEQGDFNAAVAPLRTVVRLAPDTPNVFADLGRSVMRSSQRQELLKEAETVLARKPEDVEALTIAVSALLGKDDQRKRLGYLRTLVRLRPEDSVLKVTLAQELVNSFLYDEARPLIEDLIRTDPNDPAAYYLRGQVGYFRGTDRAALAQAEADFKKTLELRANVARTQLFLGRVYLRQGQAKKAIEPLSAAAERMPENPDVHFELARAFRLIGDRETSAKAQSEFVRLREQATLAEAMAKRCGAFPEDFDLHLKTARLMIRKGDPDKAIYYVNRALTIRPNDPAGMSVARELDQILTGGGPR